MKTKLGVLAMTCGLAAPLAQADTLLGLYMGAQAWNMDSEGGFANVATLTEFDYSGETLGSYYLAFEHPVPLVPNAKVIHTEMDTSGNTTLSQDFVFAGDLFASGSVANTDIELSHTDYILYYELFDNDLISFDLGLNGKYVDGTLMVTDAGDATRVGQQAFSGVVPMLYTRLAVGLPFTGLGAYVEGSYLSFDHTIYDYQAAVTYSFIESLAVDMTLQLGYRAMLLELDDLDGIYSDMEFNGAFAGLEIHF